MPHTYTHTHTHTHTLTRPTGQTQAVSPPPTQIRSPTSPRGPLLPVTGVSVPETVQEQKKARGLDSSAQDAAAPEQKETAGLAASGRELRETQTERGTERDREGQTETERDREGQRETQQEAGLAASGRQLRPATEVSPKRVTGLAASGREQRLAELTKDLYRHFRDDD